MQTTVDLLATHRAALAQYEADIKEAEENEWEHTANLFRVAAERRRKVILELEQQNEQTKKIGANEFCSH